MKNTKQLIIILICCLVLCFSVLYSYRYGVSGRNLLKDFFVNASGVGQNNTKLISLTDNMNETGERRVLLASALLLFDPRLRKYQDPRLYDIYVVGEASQAWKSNLRSKIYKLADDVIDQILGGNNQDMIVVFDQPNLMGNITIIPLERNFPQTLIDGVLFRKYIKWNPPSSMISAVVPQGFRLEVIFDNDVGKAYIEEGLTKSFVIPEPISEIKILKTSENKNTTLN